MAYTAIAYAFSQVDYCFAYAGHLFFVAAQQVEGKAQGDVYKRQLCQIASNFANEYYDFKAARDRHGFVGIAILPESRRRGLGYAALKLLCRYASETVGAHSLAAQVATDNEASRRMFAKAGFHTCGSLRSWIRRGKHYADVLLYQILFP